MEADKLVNKYGTRLGKIEEENPSDAGEDMKKIMKWADEVLQ